MAQDVLLIFTCQDTYGIIASVTTFLSSQGAFICELSEFGDRATGKFFLRCHMQFEKGMILEELSERFRPLAGRFQAKWRFLEPSYAPKVLILVSKMSHCLNDLLYRWQAKRLQIDVRSVISNHPDLEEMVRRYQLPFQHLPVNPENKRRQEETILSIIEEQQIDLVILARYMQILDPFLTDRLPGRIINIHHSFLPSFAGAKPYHQAYERGVKIIGATAHYVTEKLDEGPIIEQEVLRVDHLRSPEDLVSLGYDVEAQVLARAVHYHIQNRVFINGNKTVIFK